MGNTPILKPVEVCRTLEKIGFVLCVNADPTFNIGTPMADARLSRCTRAVILPHHYSAKSLVTLG